MRASANFSVHPILLVKTIPMDDPIISIVIPCYNEQEALPMSIPKLLDLLATMTEEHLISADSFILCSNDGSTDETWEILRRMHQQTPQVRAISLAHNRGHQYALMAGLMYVCNKCDAAVSIDADLQDDPFAIREMVQRFRAGDEIVYGVRNQRTTDTWFKRTTAHAFYTLQRQMGVDTIYDHADYRLMSNRALCLLQEYQENNLFLRGIVPAIGLKHSVVQYARAERIAGESKYPFSKMLALSIDGITSFSAKPMSLIFMIGLLMLVLDLLVAIWVLVAHFSHHSISGWSSLMLSIWFLGGLIMCSIGIVGEYIGKIFVEVKHRPRYAIAEEIWS
jgi:glycosyltransferase involved in cell wall biosynthesis